VRSIKKLYVCFLVTHTPTTTVDGRTRVLFLNVKCRGACVRYTNEARRSKRGVDGAGARGPDAKSITVPVRARGGGRPVPANGHYVTPSVYRSGTGARVKVAYLFYSLGYVDLEIIYPCVAWLRHRRLGVPHSTSTAMIAPVLTTGIPIGGGGGEGLDTRLAARGLVNDA